MEHQERAEEYERLRAEYNAAFARLRTDATAEAAMDTYRECRERLARFLISLRPAGESEATVDFQTVSGWLTAKQGPLAGDRVDQVQALAYRLWEEAGRPTGSSQEHWYRAEQLLQGASRQAP
jgi:Protein of unknown function (DUF2934)